MIRSEFISISCCEYAPVLKEAAVSKIRQDADALRAVDDVSNLELLTAAVDLALVDVDREGDAQRAGRVAWVR